MRFLLVFICSIRLLFSQPGPQPIPYYVPIYLHSFDEDEFRKKPWPVRDQSGDYYDVRYIYVIDDETRIEDFSKINTLSYLMIELEGDELPFALSQVELSLVKRLTVNFKENSIDLKGFPKFPNLETVEVQNFKGGDLPSFPYVEKLIFKNLLSKKIPDNLSAFSSLKSISIQSQELEDIDALVSIKRLESIDISCDELNNFPVFNTDNNIAFLFFHASKLNINWEHISMLKSLKSLSVSGNGIEKIPSLSCPELEHVSLYNLPELRDVSNISRQSKLQSLIISRTGIHTIRVDASKLPQLNLVRFHDNMELKIIDLGQTNETGSNLITPLNHYENSKNGEFTIFDSPELKSIAGIENVGNIERLMLHRLDKLIELDLGNSRLKTLEMIALPSLQKLEGLVGLYSLKYLQLGNVGITSFPESFEQLDSLADLDIKFCSKLSNIEGLKNMTGLDNLMLYHIPNLEVITKSLSTNPNLKYISLKHLEKLKSAPGFSGSKSLNSIFIEGLHTDFKLPKDLNTSLNIKSLFIKTTTTDISMVSEMKHLKLLHIKYLRSEIPESLYSNVNVEDISITHSDVTDVSQLVRFKNLKTVKLQSNYRLGEQPKIEGVQFK